MTPIEYLTSIISPLLSVADDLELIAKDDELGTLITLRVNKEDMKTIIGRGGQTISAFRTLLRVFGGKSASRLNLKLLEEDEVI